MKQYKKQVDGYKGQVKEMKAEMDGLKTELGVYQQQVCTCVSVCLIGHKYRERPELQ